jgi:16S rRNA (cytidine1402-2'-O)-methyltransferase
MSRFEQALAASHAATASQDHPSSCLYVVATPIGNMADMSLRALHVLSLADTLACEDTRHSQTLLRLYGIEKPAHAWLALHQHNEAQASQEVIVRLRQGQRAVYLSDAGTPAISDPGARLVNAVQANQLRCIPIPGSSSVTCLLSVSGLAGDGQFVFRGFLSSKSAERQQSILEIAQDARAQVILEAPHRIVALAKDLASLDHRLITIGRELTKQFEQIHQLNAIDLPAWLSKSESHTRGEFALVIHPMNLLNNSLASAERILDLLLKELPLKTAVQLTSEITGEARNPLYELALQKRGASEA